MTRAMLVGDTDYSHQPLENMEVDLNNWRKNLVDIVKTLENNETQLKEKSYWMRISYNVQGYFGYSLIFFKTGLKEIESILSDFKDEIRRHHVNRIRSLAKTAKEVYMNLGKYWHEDPWDSNKDFKNPNFKIVEHYYQEARGMAADMIDLGNLASRLDDFVGMKREAIKETNKEQKEETTPDIFIDMVKTFVSYSWDNDDHKKWVRDLAARLRNDGIDVILDQWHLVPGDQLPEFMERAIRESDYILIICTHKYKERSNNRQGGVGYEGDIMTAEVMSTQNQRKFIPILRRQPWIDSAPDWLIGKYYIDLSSSPYPQEQYDDLLTTLLRTREKAPLIGFSIRGQTPLSVASSKGNISSEFEPIKIIGIIVDQVGAPRNDGTRGSALYKTPFRLSQRPPSEWAELFIQNWDHPPRFSTMHRPGIASVVGDTVVLDGTTIEEVKDYHRDTLVLIIQETNKGYKEVIERKQKANEVEQEKLKTHKQKVDDISSQIKFGGDLNDT